MTLRDVATRIVEWAAPLKLAFGLDDTGTYAHIFTPGGETNWFLRTNNGEFFVGTRNRASEEFFDIATLTEDDMEKYLVSAVSPSVRAEQLPEVPRLAPHVRLEEITPGFTLVPVDDGSPHGILLENGQYRARFSSFKTAMHAVRFSQYANATVEEIKASYADEFGKPIFTVDVTQVSA
ncbi:immunity protein 61 of polymorphic toxin system [Glaciihabitans tibetensis]|uniref:Immunity protein 61 of polymorphic toxin system n=1 Tax=Glaciihabitans tibetensis TaxID=1266600 RepID=A0A2T0VF57_9MICO|nr:Imm61 family immunity protein [Glaciihabitans tibetensis]PRY68838.1 immunity protein 61 of polymorphic toxin system [Glaciihabitans tibetensis]